MPLCMPVLVIRDEDLINVSGEKVSSGCHVIQIKKGIIDNCEVTFYCKYYSSHGNLTALTEAVIEVLMSSLYSYVLGKSVSKSRLIVNSKGEVIGSASIGLPGFFNMNAIGQPATSALIRQKFRIWENKPLGLIRLPLCAWVFGDNDLHHHNFGWCTNPDQPEELLFCKIDHGFIYHEIPFIGGLYSKIKHWFLNLHPSEITDERLLNFPICRPGRSDDYGRYWPFIATDLFFASRESRSTRFEQECFVSLWKHFSLTTPPRNILKLEKENIIRDLISLLQDREWQTLCDYLLIQLPLLCGMLKGAISNALRYVLNNVIDHRLKALNEVYSRADLVQKAQLIGAPALLSPTRLGS